MKQYIESMSKFEKVFILFFLIGAVINLVLTYDNNSNTMNIIEFIGWIFPSLIILFYRMIINKRDKAKNKDA